MSSNKVGIVVILFSLALCLAGTTRNASAALSESDFVEIAETHAVQTVEVYPIRTLRELSLSFGILLFGALIIYLQYRHISGSNNFTPKDVLLVYVVTLVIVGTLFLISAGWSSDDIAPAIGLFGTVVGYLLGQKSNTDKED